MAKNSKEEGEKKSKKILQLSLADIKQLGGDEDDLKLLAEIDDDEDEIKCEEDDDYDDILTKVELRQFAKSLKFHELPKNINVVKDGVQKTESQENDGPGHDEKKEKKVKGNKYKASKNEQKLNEIVAEVNDPALPPPKPFNPALIGPPISHNFRNSMLVEPIRKWFETEVATISEECEKVDVSPSKISEFETYAKQLLDHDVELYKKYQESSKNRSNFHWIHTVQRSGTAADKMAAYTVLLQDSSVHNLSTLDGLIRLVDTRRKNECLMAVDTLKDVFLEDLLLENKKFHTFDQHPFGSLAQLLQEDRTSYDKQLLLWYFESCLKKTYNQFIGGLCTMLRDSIEATKRKALKIMYELLASNPEQEQILLKNIVNKIGDPQQKVTSLCCSLLCRLVDKHPNMKGVIVSEVERLLFRQNLAPKALYYAVCFLNQLLLDLDDKAVAAKLISIYFSLFKAATKKGEVTSKLMCALLTGVNRAFPYAKLEMATLEDQINTLYKIVHAPNFNISVQALMLLYHALDSASDFSDRFYGALYRKLLDPQLKHSSKQTMFLNLLYKSLKKDQAPQRIAAFIKRILQITSEQSPAMMCGLLFLISEITFGASRHLLLSQQAVHSVNDIADADDDDDDDEKYDDIPEDDENEHIMSENINNEKLPSNDNIPVKNCENTASSWIHRANLDRPHKSVTDNHSKSIDYNQYDPYARNPLYAGADKACIWELIPLSTHFHPSVALFASNILSGQRISYSGDPLQDFTLSRFLNRFVYRNPKKVSSDSEVPRQRTVLGKRKYYTPVGATAFAINSTSYCSQPQSRIPIEEQFFHKYFVDQKQFQDERDKRVDEDLESIQSDEVDEFLNRFDRGSRVDEYDLDYANEFKSQTKASKGKKKPNEEEDGSDEDVDFDDEDFADAFKDFDEDIKAATAGDEFEDMELSDDGRDQSDDDVMDLSEEEDDFEDNDDDNDMSNIKGGRKKHKGLDTSKLFASAEEFSSVLDENATGLDMTGLEALANKDNAHVKQLRWEQERDRWVRGVDWKNKKKSGKLKTKPKQWKTGRHGGPVPSKKLSNKRPRGTKV